MTIAETIKQLRESVGMTRKEFSQHTGIPVRTLEDWEGIKKNSTRIHSTADCIPVKSMRNCSERKKMTIYN